MLHDITYMQNLKSKQIVKQEQLQIRRTNGWLSEGDGKVEERNR